MKKLCREVAKKINWDEKEVYDIVHFFFQEFREKMRSIPLKGKVLTEEEFLQHITSFKIPKLGTLVCDYDYYIKIRKHIDRKKNERNKSNKKDQTDV